jgi:hypothetical protein
MHSHQPMMKPLVASPLSVKLHGLQLPELEQDPPQPDQQTPDWLAHAPSQQILMLCRTAPPHVVKLTLPPAPTVKQLTQGCESLQLVPHVQMME